MFHENVIATDTKNTGPATWYDHAIKQEIPAGPLEQLLGGGDEETLVTQFRIHVAEEGGIGIGTGSHRHAALG